MTWCGLPDWLLLLQRLLSVFTGVAFMLIGESLEDLQHRHEPLR
jgi:hypothetical protein